MGINENNGGRRFPSAEGGSSFSADGGTSYLVDGVVVPNSYVSEMIGENIEAQAAELEQTLLDDLTARGLVQPVYFRKAREYARFFRQKAALDLDIEERGVMVWDEKRGCLVDNPALSRAVQIANMMQTIFRDLGFREAAISSAKAADTGGGVDDLL